MASEIHYRQASTLSRNRVLEALKQIFPDHELPVFTSKSRYGFAQVESENWRNMADFLSAVAGQPDTVSIETFENEKGEPENIEVETVELENGEEVTGENAEESEELENAEESEVVVSDGDYEANYITGFVSDPVDNAFGFIEEDEEQSAPDENATPADEMTYADFEEFFNSESIVVEGTGKNGKITLTDYRKAFNAL